MNEKRPALWLLVPLAALLLCSCAKKSVWRFALETRRDADDRTARDGTLLSWYSYELPRLTLVCESGSGEPPAELAAVCEAFNAESEQRHGALLDGYREMEQLAIAAYPGGGAEFAALGERVEITETWQTEFLLSVRADGWADWGGAHPVSFLSAWSFDLTAGKPVAWYELTDCPDALRAAIARAILGQIDLSDGWFSDCAARVEALRGAELYFMGDGLRAAFPSCALAPRAKGAQTFTVSYETLAPYLNARGRLLLPGKSEG